jgi:predicted HTH transcriptional regulator
MDLLEALKRPEGKTAIRVHPFPSRPHHPRREGPEAGAYVRVGSTNRRADRELIEERRRLACGGSFDEQAMPDLDSEELDFRATSESFASRCRRKRADLEDLKRRYFLVDGGDA